MTITGDLPPEALDAIGELYSWLRDSRSKAPNIPRAMATTLRDLDHAIEDSLQVQSAQETLPNGDIIAVARVGADVLFMVKDAAPWRIRGAALDGADPWLGDKPGLLLVLGSDAREGQNQRTLRADSIHLVGLDPARPHASIVGFPRDAWVQGPAGGSKFTDVMANRGPEVMVETTAELTGLEIDGYVVTGFAGFEGLIRDLGGLVIELPRAIRSGIKGWEDYPSGRQKLGGLATLRLARIRKTIPGGDFGRSANHGLIMLAALRTIQEMGVDKLPHMIGLLLKHTWTDLPSRDLLMWGAALYHLPAEDMVNMVMPGSVGSVSGQSVVFLAKRADGIYADLADGVIDER